jgi:ATP-dependent Clp protease ATP-binding subunit ClpB
MQSQKFTQKTIEAFQDAQQYAIEHNNPTVSPLHVIYALINQE